MKIIRIIARLNVGGPAKHVVWLTAGLQSAECETLLVAGTVPPGEDDMGYFADELGVRPLFISSMSREVSLKDALTIWRLFRLFLRERPDIVHTHTAKAGTVGRIAGLLYRWLTPTALVGRPRACKFIHTYHGHIFHSYYGRFKTKLFVGIERMLARFATDRIVVISGQQRREINEEFRVGRAEQFVVIPLGLDTEIFSDWHSQRSAFRDELGASADQILVGIVGRLTEIKNHDLFLRAAASFFKNNRDKSVRFVLIGDGQLRDQLQAQVESLGISDAVVFTGSRNDPERFYPAFDIVALTSQNEGTPLTLIEAMLNARPVISTAVGGVVDLLGEPTETGNAAYDVCERGVRVRSGDAAGFAAGLARLVDDKSLRANLGTTARQYAEKSHAKERLLTDISSLYHDVIGADIVAVKAQVRQTPQFVVESKPGKH